VKAAEAKLAKAVDAFHEIGAMVTNKPKSEISKYMACSIIERAHWAAKELKGGEE
jgi:hypothetical protein